MERNPGIDIMGGSVVDVPLMRSRRFPQGEIFPTDATPLAPLGSRIGGLEVVDKVPTFYMPARSAWRSSAGTRAANGRPRRLLHPRARPAGHRAQPRVEV